MRRIHTCTLILFQEYITESSVRSQVHIQKETTLAMVAAMKGARVYIHVYMCTYMYLCVHTCIYVCASASCGDNTASLRMPIYIYIYIYIYIAGSLYVWSSTQSRHRIKQTYLTFLWPVWPTIVHIANTHMQTYVMHMAKSAWVWGHHLLVPSARAPDCGKWIHHA